LELVRLGLTAAARLAQLGVAHVVVDAGVAAPDPPGRASLDAILGERGVGQRERLAFSPSPAAGRPSDRCRHVVLDPAIRNSEREDGAQRGQSASRGRWGQAAGDQTTDPG